MRPGKFSPHHILVQNGSFEIKKKTSEFTGVLFILQCRLAESNCGHMDFQSIALPTELKRHLFFKVEIIYMFDLKLSSTFCTFYIVFIDLEIFFVFKKFGYIRYIKKIFNSVLWLFTH